MEPSPAFDPEVVRAIFDRIWSRRRADDDDDDANFEAEASTSKKIRKTSVNSNALKVSCELLQMFVAEAVQRAAAIADAEGNTKIEPTHLERILPQLLLDF